MKGKRVIGISLLLTCLLACAACAQSQTGSSATSENAATASTSSAVVSENESTTSEGVDTPCAVTYSASASDLSALFLAEGDTVAVISPSSLPSQKSVDETVEGLKQWGYVPVVGKYVCTENRTLANALEDLTWALEDPSIKAVFCVRGGYGASEVADILPLDLVVSAHKLIIGYSDITAFHSAWTKVKLPSVHASMSVAFDGLAEECVEVEQRVLHGEIPTYTCPSSALCKTGEADGVLIGGNLATFTAVLGTAYDCTQTDEPYILFLEDVGENVQHLHRYLTILKHLGVLNHASGIVFGQWVDVPADMEDYSGDTRGGTFSSVDDMITRQILEDYGVPVAFDFPAGHGATNYPLLMGVKAHLSVSADSYTLSWPEA